MDKKKLEEIKKKNHEETWSMSGEESRNRIFNSLPDEMGLVKVGESYKEYKDLNFLMKFWRKICLWYYAIFGLTKSERKKLEGWREKRELQIESYPVTANPRKIKANWTNEMAEALENLHGIDIRNEEIEWKPLGSAFEKFPKVNVIKIVDYIGHESLHLLVGEDIRIYVDNEKFIEARVEDYQEDKLGVVFIKFRSESEVPEKIHDVKYAYNTNMESLSLEETYDVSEESEKDTRKAIEQWKKDVENGVGVESYGVIDYESGYSHVPPTMLNIGYLGGKKIDLPRMEKSIPIHGVEAQKELQEMMNDEKESFDDSVAIILVDTSEGRPGDEESYSKVIYDHFFNKENLIPKIDFDVVPIEKYIANEVWQALEESYPELKCRIVASSIFKIFNENEQKEQLVRVVKFKKDKYRENKN